MAFLLSEGNLCHQLGQSTAPPDYSITGEGPLVPYHQEGT